MALVPFIRVSGRGGALVAFEVGGEVTEDTHWQVMDDKAELCWHIEHEQAVHTGLVKSHDGGAFLEGRIAGKERVKGIVGAGIVIERRRELQIHLLGEVDLRSDLLGEEQGVGVGNAVPSGKTAGAERVLRIGVVIDELREVREDIDRDLVWLAHARS